MFIVESVNFKTVFKLSGVNIILDVRCAGGIQWFPIWSTWILIIVPPIIIIEIGFSVFLSLILANPHGSLDGVV